MMLMLLVAALASMPNGDDRLMIGSVWRCSAALPNDRYSANLVVEPGRSDSEKKLRITSATGGVPTDGYGIGMLRADHFAQNGSDLIAEFGHGFSNFGLRLLAQWDRSDEGISLHLSTWNATAKSFAEKNEKSYLLACQALSAGEKA